MYYKYQVLSNIADSIDALNCLCFHIKLRENMAFIIGGCYFQIEKNHDYRFVCSDTLSISCYQKNKNKKEAMEKIGNALEFFVFLTGAPYDINGGVIESIEDTLPIINVNLSKKKMLNIQAFEYKYQRIKSKRSLLENSLHLFSVGIKLNYLFDESDCEDAFLTFFKIIESIVKDTFLIEINKIDKGVALTQQYVTTILKYAYKIDTTSDKLSDICGKTNKMLFEYVFDGIYHKIIWFLRKFNIRIDCDKVSRIVDIRNKIAHGDNIEFRQYSKEYEYTCELVYKIILVKFFDLSLPIIGSTVKIC